MRALVTGGSGFIGLNLVKYLISKNVDVVVVDKNKCNLNCKSYMLDISNTYMFCEALKEEKFDIIYHLAANTNIRLGEKDSSIDFKDTFCTTYSVLELMKQNNIKGLFFASTSAIYGTKNSLLKEDIGDLKPISYYGASKLASENFISSYSYMNNFNSLIFRFPNVIGYGLNHGVIYDFVNKLNNNSKELEILGDGNQTKQYMDVSELVETIYLFTKRIDVGINIYNIGVEDSISVKEIADIICDVFGYKDVLYKYSGGSVGWNGDVACFKFDLTKIHNKGWFAKCSSVDAVKNSVKYLKENK